MLYKAPRHHHLRGGGGGGASLSLGTSPQERAARLRQRATTSPSARAPFGSLGHGIDVEGASLWGGSQKELPGSMCLGEHRGAGV